MADRERVLRVRAKLRSIGERLGWFDQPIDLLIAQLEEEIQEQIENNKLPSTLLLKDPDRSDPHVELPQSITKIEHVVLDVSSDDESSHAVPSTKTSQTDFQHKSLRERMLIKYNPEKSTGGSDSDDLDSFLSKHRTPRPPCFSGTPGKLDTRHVSRGSLDEFIISDGESASEKDESSSSDLENDVFSMPTPRDNKENTCGNTWLLNTPKQSRETKGRKTAATTGNKLWQQTAKNRIAENTDVLGPRDRPRSTLDAVTTPFSSQKDFKKNKDRLVQDLFNLYNKTVFDNKLPSDFSITWNNKMRKTAGYCYYSRKSGVNTARIELADKVIDCVDRLRDTLIHELCHAAAWLISRVKAGHGPVWKNWAARANFVLQELPPISRCHSYKINTKFTYICTNEFCSNSFGRHSKSVNLEKQRCGYCHSRLMLKTPVNKDGTPAQTRTPNKFAMFVKENYGKVKKQGMAHKEVMKELSLQFGVLNVK